MMLRGIMKTKRSHCGAVRRFCALMNIRCVYFLIAMLLSFAWIASGQGFFNLDFEDADLTGYSPGNGVPASSAFPGWTVNAPYILYDNFSLSGASISIIDTESSYRGYTIQGSYYADFEPANTPESPFYQSISLGQTGTIPVGTESITFWGNIGGLQITFDGQSLAFSEIGSTANYNIYGANISQFAGDTGQLLFTMPPHSIDPGLYSAQLDNIQFSSSPIPEPGTFALLGLGVAFLIWHFVKRGASPWIRREALGCFFLRSRHG